MKVIDQHNILTLLMPTNEPETLKRFWLPSLNNLTEIVPISTIAINFQYPYTEREVNDIVSQIESYGFRVKYQLRDKYNVEGKGMVPFNQIRHDTAMLNPDSLFYALTDDDFSYQGPSASVHKTAGAQYLDIIHYMLAHAECGFTLIGGPMIKAVDINHIGLTNPYTTFYAVKKGYILRNMKDYGFCIYPDDAIDMKGAGEEKIIAASRLAEGLYPATMKCGRTHHYENWKKDGVKNGAEDYGWELQEVLDNNVHKYLNEHYNVHVDRLTNMWICDPSIYYSRGGYEYTDDVRKKLDSDYSEYNIHEILSMINEIVKEKYYGE